MKTHLFTILLIYLLTLKLHAEVITDGTLGSRVNLSGDDFQITADLGRQEEGNLFHSFQDFNLNSSEIATFSGPDEVQNILSRVTGGSSSNIDGLIRSEIPNANLYLLNPNGIIFGENANLDIQGSFHASTAHYLRLGDNSKFYASRLNKPLLSSAPPQAFGFLDNPVSITIQGSRLFVPPKQTLSVIGGDLIINDGILLAPSGQINLAAVVDKGEIALNFSDLTINNLANFGKITISQASINQRFLEFTIKPLEEFNEFASPFIPANIDVSDYPSEKDMNGFPSGQIFIRAGQLVLNKGSVFADTYQGNGLNIDISVDNLQLQNGAKITAHNFGDSQGGHIKITSDEITFTGINDEFENYNIGGNIMINPDNYNIIGTDNHGNGIGGNININTNFLELNPGIISSTTENKGKAGDITINAKDIISILNASFISASTAQYSRGDAGNITLNTQHLRLNNAGEINSFSYSDEDEAGDAGTIDITANTVSLTDSGNIVTEALNASGGQINLQIKDSLSVAKSVITTQVLGDETHDNAGDITINNPLLFALNRGEILANANVGNGGNIKIIAENFIQSSDSILNASSKLGIDGEIQITATDENFSNSLVILTKTLADASRLLAKSCVESARDESHFVVADYLSDADIEDMLKNSQPPSFQAGLPKAKILAVYHSLQKQLATSARPSKILSQLAALYAYEQRYPEALQLNKQALRALKLLNAPYWRYKLQWQRGSLFKALGEYKSAIIAYQAAIQKLVPIRQHLTKIYRERYPNGESSEFREVLKPIFTELVALLLELAESSQTTAKNELLKKALQYMDQLKTAELQDYFQDECTKPTIDLEQVEPLHTAIIYPIFLPNRVKLLVSLPGGKRLHQTVPATPQQITRTINTLATFLHCQTKYQTTDCQENHSYREFCTHP